MNLSLWIFQGYFTVQLSMCVLLLSLFSLRAPTCSDYQLCSRLSRTFFFFCEFFSPHVRLVFDGDRYTSTISNECQPSFFEHPMLRFTATSKYAIRLVELVRKRLIGYLDVAGIWNLHHISKTENCEAVTDSLCWLVLRMWVEGPWIVTASSLAIHRHLDICH